MGVRNCIKGFVLRCRINKLNKNKKADVKLANTVLLDKNTKITAYPGTSISIGNGVYLRSNPDGYHTGMPFPTVLIADKNGAKISIGEYCRLNGVYVHAQKEITIGNNCVIASGVNIIDSNGHVVLSSNRTVGRDEAKPIIIGNNVWIGVNSIVLKGVSIGDNSVVSAGSVVCGGDYPKNSLIQGNPGKVVGILKIE